jgi:hypothetical protein
LAHFLEDEESTERLTCPACGTIFKWDKLSNSATIFYTERDETTATAIAEKPDPQPETSYETDGQEPLSPDELNLKVSKVQKDLELERDLRRWRFIQLFVFATLCLTLLGTLNGVVKDHQPWLEALRKSAAPAIFLGLLAALIVAGLFKRGQTAMYVGRKLFSTAFRTGKEPDLTEIAEELRRPRATRRPLPTTESPEGTDIGNHSIRSTEVSPPSDSQKTTGSTGHDQGISPSA